MIAAFFCREMLYHLSCGHYRLVSATQDKLEDVVEELEGKNRERDELVRYSTALRDLTQMMRDIRKSRFSHLHKLTTHMALRVKHKFTVRILQYK